MPLNKEKLGNLITQIDKRNKAAQLGVERVRGISVKKVFTTTKADLYGVSLNNYKIVPPQTFAYVADTSRRGDKIAIAFNDSKDEYLISSIYTTFAIKSQQLLPEYLELFFNRAEFDRLARFNSWGSARETFDWKDFCEVEVEIPPLIVQKRYIAIYKAIQDDLKVHIQSSAYLRTVFRVYLEKIKQTAEKVSLQSHIELCSERNGEALGIDSVRGVSIQKKFIYTKADMGNVSLKSYYVVKPNEFCYVPITSRNGDKISLAINDSQENYLVSSTYVVFRVKDTKKLNPKYLFLWLSTSEFDRYARFNSWGSAREAFDWAALESLEIPMPDIAIQNGIVGLLEAQRKEEKAFEKTTDVVSGICSILIAGALKEGAKS